MLRPSVASAMRPSTNGVTAAPTTPAGVAVVERPVQHRVELVGVELVGLGDRHADEDTGRRPRAMAQRRPPPRPPNRHDAARAAPTNGCRTPGTSRDASRAPARRRSRGTRACAARSRNALAPAHTVMTGWWASASRSALTSPVSSAPRCTPPIPPVANTSIPADAASATDAETVVAPNSHRCATATARSRSAALRAGPRMRVVLGVVEPDPCNAVEHGRDRGHRAARRGSPPCSGRAPRRWPATATRGWRRSSTRGRRRRHRRTAPSRPPPTTSACSTASVCQRRASRAASPSATNLVTASTWCVIGNRSSTSVCTWR